MPAICASRGISDPESTRSRGAVTCCPVVSIRRRSVAAFCARGWNAERRATGRPLSSLNTSTVDLLGLLATFWGPYGRSATPPEQPWGRGQARRWEGATKQRTVAANCSSSTTAQELARPPWCAESRRDEKAAGANARSARRCWTRVALGSCRAMAALWWCWARADLWWCWTVASRESRRGGLRPLPARRRTHPRTREPRTPLPPRRLCP
jgi:hypothetical protein